MGRWYSPLRLLLEVLKYRESDGIKVNKSHAACYAYISYQTGYLKANYPLEYMCALLQVFYTEGTKVVKYAKVSRDMGFEVLAPDINRSEKGFIIDGENAIRFGFGAIKGIGDASIDAILEERHNGQFTSMQNLINRIPRKNLNKAALSALTYSGALDSLMPEEFTNRPSFLAYILETLRGDKLDKELIEEIATYTDRTKFEREFKTLGLYVSGHILDRYAEPIEWDEMDDSPHHTTVLITEVKRIITKKGTPMAFLEVDTLEGTRSLTLFPQQYAKTAIEGLVPGMLAKINVKAQMNWQKNQKDYILNAITIPKKINDKMWKEINKKKEGLA